MTRSGHAHDIASSLFGAGNENTSYQVIPSHAEPLTQVAGEAVGRVLSDKKRDRRGSQS